MGEKMMSIGEIVATLIVLVVFIATVIVLLYLFVSSRPVIETKSLIRTNAELMDNIFTSNLAVQKAVFDAKELDRLKGTNIEAPVRHCSIGYSMLVTAKDDQWLWGYKPKVFTNAPSVAQEYPAAAVVKGEILPAKVSLTVYDSMMTRISCATEKAYKLGEVQSMETPCTLTATKGGKFSIKKKQNNQQFVCVGVVFATPLLFSSKPAQSPEETECRYLPDVTFGDLSYECKEGSEKAKLKFYPTNAAGSKDCKTLKENPVIAKKGEVQMVVLCVE